MCASGGMRAITAFLDLSLLMWAIPTGKPTGGPVVTAGAGMGAVTVYRGAGSGGVGWGWEGGKVDIRDREGGERGGSPRRRRGWSTGFR